MVSVFESFTFHVAALAEAHEVIGMVSGFWNQELAIGKDVMNWQTFSNMLATVSAVTFLSIDYHETNLSPISASVGLCPTNPKRRVFPGFKIFPIFVSAFTRAVSSSKLRLANLPRLSPNNIPTVFTRADLFNIYPRWIVLPTHVLRLKPTWIVRGLFPSRIQMLDFRSALTSAGTKSLSVNEATRYIDVFTANLTLLDDTVFSRHNNSVPRLHGTRTSGNERMERGAQIGMGV